LRPTPRAMELSEPLHTTLMTLEALLDPQKFVAETEKRTFTLAVGDYFVTTIAPKLASYLSENAPHISIRTKPTVYQALEQLDRGEIDFAVCPVQELPERFGSEFLAEDDYHCVVRADHPQANAAPSMEQYAAMKHLVVNLNGDSRGFVDDELEKHGLTRHVAMTVNSFGVTSAILDANDFVLTAPGRIVKSFAPTGYFVFPCPVAAPVSLRRLELVWHSRLSNHPAHRWFRTTLKEVAASL
jgi:DNA-binding transcriptional LysR family regulator